MSSSSHAAVHYDFLKDCIQARLSPEIIERIADLAYAACSCNRSLRDHWLGWPAGLQQQVVWRFRRHGFRVCLQKRISILGNDARSWSIATCRHVSSSVQYAKMNTDALVDFMFKLHWCSLSSDILCDARSTGLSQRLCDARFTGLSQRRCERPT